MTDQRKSTEEIAQEVAGEPTFAQLKRSIKVVLDAERSIADARKLEAQTDAAGREQLHKILGLTAEHDMTWGTLLLNSRSIIEQLNTDVEFSRKMNGLVADENADLRKEVEKRDKALAWADEELLRLNAGKPSQLVGEISSLKSLIAEKDLRITELEKNLNDR